VTARQVPTRTLARRRGAEDRGSLALGAAGAVALVLWAGSNGYRQSLLVTIATYALVALGMYIPFVLAGSLSLAYGAYASIGGYAVGIVSAYSGLPIWVAWLAGPAVAATVAVLLGLATRRLSGFYLAAATLLFGTAFQAWLVDAQGITGGSAGIGGLRRLALLGWHPGASTLVMADAALVCLIAYAIDRLRLSPWGTLVRAMREVPVAVEATGVRVPVMNLVALAIGAAVGSLGGALFTQSVGSVTPDTFTLSIVFLAIFMPLIGGTGTPWGAVAGAVIVVDLTLNFSLLKTSGLLVVSLAVLLVMLVARRGVVGYLDSARRHGLRLLRIVTARDR